MLRHLLGIGGGAASAPGVRQVTVAELRQTLAAHEDVQLIDVRSPDEFAHDGHIAGARLIPLPALALRMHEISRDQPVAVICRSGNRSQIAAEMLARAGYPHVRNVQGGMGAWLRAGYAAQ